MGHIYTPSIISGVCIKKKIKMMKNQMIVEL